MKIHSQVTGQMKATRQHKKRKQQNDIGHKEKKTSEKENFLVKYFNLLNKQK
jgi:hypothetical protein